MDRGRRGRGRNDIRRNRNEISGRGADIGHRNDGPASVRRTYPTALHRLQELLSKDDRVVILTLQDKNFGFKELLSAGKLSYDVLSTVIELLALSIKCDLCPQNLLALLNDVLSSELFAVHVPRYLTTAPHDLAETKLDRIRLVIANLARVFEALLNRLPNKASERLGVAFLTIRDVIQRFDISDKPIDRCLVDTIERLEKLRSENLAKYDSGVRDKLSAAEAEHARPPPTDFRSMAIFPIEQDIHETLHPFLRANLVRGRYVDAEHYLDVHFRLLREDFVAPLRDGLTKYIALVNRGKMNEAHQQKDIKIYLDVRMVSMETSMNDGVLYVINFDVTRLPKVRWEMSKRLMYGSLICISTDNFRSFKLGIVINRDPKKLAEGYLSIRLMGSERMDPRDVHILAESPAYFEAYNPILRGLQTMNDNTIPLKRYIIDASTELGSPRYLLANMSYDFGPLMGNSQNPNLCRVLGRENDDGTIIDEWPTAEALKLDAAQYSALKLCLTKELAVVQGPPGTGKTFLGLKVVEMLLKNSRIWSNEAEQSPILIVCYTNHALDQFLEGILRFHPTDLVRIGGQSKCLAIAPYSISSLRREATGTRGLPAYVYMNRKTLYEQLRNIEGSIKCELYAVEQAQSRILHEDTLKSSMRPKHYQQLCQGVNNFNAFWQPQNVQPKILIWLNLAAANLVENGDQQEDYFEAIVRDLHNVNEDRPFEIDDDLAVEEMRRRIHDVYFDEDDRGDTLDDRIRRGFLQKTSRPRFADFTEVVDDDGYQVQGGVRKLKQTVNREMKKISMMTNDEADQVDNVWRLAVNNRWRLYRHWIGKLKNEKMVGLRRFQAEYERIHLQLKEVLREMDVAILRRAKIIGMTTTGAAKNRELLQIVAPKIVIVEEAAEVLEAHIITALSVNCEHLILIGDQQQLRPNPTVYRLARDYNLDVSLFERLIGNQLPYERLLIQHRMRPRISKLLVPHIYKNLRDHSSVSEYPHVLGFVNDVFFLSHGHAETVVNDSSSRANGFEARFLLGICRHLLLQGYKSEQITILATYLGQVFLIKQLMANTISKDVYCTVVDNYQGEENDIILLSLVRSNDDGKVGFLKVDNRICVALSRAKIGLFCVGNFQFLADNAKIWSDIVDSMKLDGLVGPRLRLCCRNHPNVCTDVASANDFNGIPEGGCNLPCDYRLSCGHQCVRMCHVYDPEHTDIKCMKPCGKVICELGHECKKLCSDPCGVCRVLVDKVSPVCGHINKVFCHRLIETINCEQPCEKILSCSHKCTKKCFYLCSRSSCTYKVPVIALCGHIVSAPCCQAADPTEVLSYCREACTEILPCEHLCLGNCNECRQTRMHVRCNAKCGRLLICGHPCEVPCARNCPPCKKKCENYCIHSKCPLSCGVPCRPCRERCAWRCDHLECTKQCFEPCNRPPCNKPCLKQLSCGHPCIGFCGEPCPKICRICDKDDEAFEIFFGTEDEDDARFVLLVDCNHVFESSGLDQFLQQNNKANELDDEGLPHSHAAVTMKRCPRCNRIIRRTLRYMTVVNQMLNDVITIKRKFFGKANQVLQLTNNLKKDLCVKLEMNLKRDSTCCFGAQRHIINLIKLKGHLSLNDVKTLTNLANLCLAMNNECNKCVNSVITLRLTELQSWFIRLDKDSSDKEISDFSREFLRVRTLSALVCSIGHQSFINENAKPFYDKAFNHLTSLQPFTEYLEKEIHHLIHEMKNNLNGLGISDIERVEIVNAMGMNRGHWYKCPNGHIYAVGECGGPMQESICPECKATIGGQNHRLHSNNALASEMDGAVAPAYPNVLVGRY